MSRFVDITSRPASCGMGKVLVVTVFEHGVVDGVVKMVWVMVSVNIA